jgi:hypothetical protein
MLTMIEVSTKEPPLSGAHFYPYWRANSPLFLHVVLFFAITLRMQHFKRKSAMWGKLRDGILPLTVHADESMVCHSYLALFNLTT